MNGRTYVYLETLHRCSGVVCHVAVDRYEPVAVRELLPRRAKSCQYCQLCNNCKKPRRAHGLVLGDGLGGCTPRRHKPHPVSARCKQRHDIDSRSCPMRPAVHKFLCEVSSSPWRLRGQRRRPQAGRPILLLLLLTLPSGRRLQTEMSAKSDSAIFSSPNCNRCPHSGAR